MRTFSDSSTFVLSNCVEVSSLCASDSHSVGREISYLLWNRNVRYHVHNNPPLGSMLSQINPVQNSTPHFLKSRYNIIVPSAYGLPICLLPSAHFRLKFFELAWIISTVCLITLPISYSLNSGVKIMKLLIMLFSSFASSSFPSASFSQTVPLMLSSLRDRPSSTPI